MDYTSEKDSLTKELEKAKSDYVSVVSQKESLTKELEKSKKDYTSEKDSLTKEVEKAKKMFDTAKSEWSSQKESYTQQINDEVQKQETCTLEKLDLSSKNDTLKQELDKSKLEHSTLKETSQKEMETLKATSEKEKKKLQVTHASDLTKQSEELQLQATQEKAKLQEDFDSMKIQNDKMKTHYTTLQELVRKERAKSKEIAESFDSLYKPVCTYKKGYTKSNKNKHIHLFSGRDGEITPEKCAKAVQEHNLKAKTVDDVISVFNFNTHVLFDGRNWQKETRCGGYTGEKENVTGHTGHEMNNWRMQYCHIQNDPRKMKLLEKKFTDSKCVPLRNDLTEDECKTWAEVNDKTAGDDTYGFSGEYATSFSQKGCYVYDNRVYYGTIKGEKRVEGTYHPTEKDKNESYICASGDVEEAMKPLVL